MTSKQFIDVVFAPKPGSPDLRFIEVESPPGKAVKVGEWLERQDGFCVLRLTDKIFKTDQPHTPSRHSDIMEIRAITPTQTLLRTIVLEAAPHVLAATGHTGALTVRTCNWPRSGVPLEGRITDPDGVEWRADAAHVRPAEDRASFIVRYNLLGGELGGELRSRRLAIKVSVDVAVGDHRDVNVY